MILKTHLGHVQLVHTITWAPHTFIKNILVKSYNLSCYLI